MSEHIPVLLKEVIAYLNIIPEGIYVDCTVGGGGHARAILERLGRAGWLVGIDQDNLALEKARQVLQPSRARVDLIRGNFRYLDDYLDRLGIKEINGVLLDLGVSSYQLGEPERGFSYQADTVLDMRMDREKPLSAQVIVNQWPEEALYRILRDFGEERWASRIARFIVEERRRRPILTTGQLVEIVKAAVPASARRKGPHPARRTFQALRIAVNDELGALSEVLDIAIQRLTAGGRIVVISFHSLEDRLVKSKFREAATACICPPGTPVCVCGRVPVLRLLTRRPVFPEAEEIERNPRSRSACLRAAEKLRASSSTKKDGE